MYRDKQDFSESSVREHHFNVGQIPPVGAVESRHQLHTSVHKGRHVLANVIVQQLGVIVVAADLLINGGVLVEIN